MRYRFALFDFDGTLADSAAWFLKFINRLADEYGFRRIEERDHDLVRSYSSQQVMKHMGVPIWRAPMLAARLRKAVARDISQIRLFSGVDSMLRELTASGLCVGVVSSNSEANIRRILGPHNVAELPHFACGASILGKAVKLRAALKKGGFSAGETIYIGDEIRDGVAAREAGMAFGAVAWGYTKIDALRKENPELEFASVQDIAARLCGNSVSQ